MATIKQVKEELEQFPEDSIVIIPPDDLDCLEIYQDIGENQLRPLGHILIGGGSFDPPETCIY